LFDALNRELRTRVRKGVGTQQFSVAPAFELDTYA